jgi:indolepyruvate ferredoxin oxidoreductase beta subunit
MIASTGRSYLVTERIAMGDGRLDSARLEKAIAEHAQSHLLVDMEVLARQSGAMINSVMLGLLAGCGRLPIPAETLEAAIRADGKAVDSNLKGFRAGLDAARQAAPPATAGAHPDTPSARPIPAGLLPTIAAMPAAAREFVAEGVRRLIAYQDEAYARLYLDRLAPIRKADERAKADGRLVREVARYLALRMSYEDVIRVAEVKIDPARMDRIAAEIGAKPGEPYTVTEFLKPGVEEMCSILPPWLARRVLAAADRRGWTDRLHWGMEVNTASVTGFLRFWLLAKLRRWRPKSHRFAQEQAAIESWLGLIQQAAQLSGDLALEVAECARLIKGYGDTHKRGSENFRLIEDRVIRPVLAGQISLRLGPDAVASARIAALADPDGEALTRCLDGLDRQNALGIAAE